MPNNNIIEKTNLVPVNNKKLLLLQYRFGKAIMNSNFSDQDARKLLSQKNSEKLFNSAVAEVFEKLGEMLRIGNLETIQLLQKFFLEVYGEVHDFSNLNFSDSETLTGRMVNPRTLNIDQRLEKICEFFKVSSWSYKTPANGNFETFQKRPSGRYTFGFGWTEKPDEKHLGKSMQNVLKEGFSIADPDEYVLMTSLYYYVEKTFMDRNNWSRLSAKWPGGYLVIGRAPSDGSFLSSGDVSCGNPDYGVRELDLVEC